MLARPEDAGVSEFLCKLTSGGQTSFEQDIELNEHARPGDRTLPVYLGVLDGLEKQLEDGLVVGERAALTKRFS